jgi:hypothetical protein
VGTDLILSGLNEFIGMKKKECELAANRNNEILKFQSMWANLDRMLSNIPQHRIEHVNFQFTSIAFQEIKKYEEMPTIVIGSEILSHPNAE